MGWLVNKIRTICEEEIIRESGNDFIWKNLLNQKMGESSEAVQSIRDELRVVRKTNTVLFNIVKDLEKELSKLKKETKVTIPKRTNQRPRLHAIIEFQKMHASRVSENWPKFWKEFADDLHRDMDILVRGVTLNNQQALAEARDEYNKKLEPEEPSIEEINKHNLLEDMHSKVDEDTMSMLKGE